MPDRTATPEELLDQWLDALNDGDAPPVPDAIADLAGVALEYRNALGTSVASPERNGKMHHDHAIASPNEASWRILAQPKRKASWSSWLATAAVVALLVGLVGGAAVRTWGLSGRDDPTQVAGIAASPGATPAAGTLSCASPGFRPVVEGEVDEAELASIGETETPLNVDGVYLHIPNASGEIVTLPNTWTPLGGPMWSNETTADASGDATIRNVDTGEEWSFADAGTPFPGMYIPPYLIVPANVDATDFRIIDTESGEDALVSEVRGERFPRPARISPIAVDYSSGTFPLRAPVVLMFNFDEAATYPNTGPDANDPDAEPGAMGENALYLPAELDDARFLPNPVYARYAQGTAFSADANRLAYATEIDGSPAIIVTRPDGDATTALLHADITADDVPLMFSEDGSMLVVSRAGGIATFDLGEESRSILASVTSDERFMPIAHNAAMMNVLVAYPDRHVAIINAASGEVTDFPDVTVPASEYIPDDPGQRLSFENDLYELFDADAGTVRIVNLVTGEVSPPTQVFNPGERWVDSTFGSQVQYRQQYPHAVWPDGNAYLDPELALNVTRVDGESWSMLPPPGFGVDDNQVAHLFTNPDDTCVFLQLMMEAGRTVISSEGQSGRIVGTWIAPLEPGADWMRLENAVTSWFPTATDEDEPQTLPAQDFASPAA